ncbi:MAG: tyrosine-type recombinase/integrase [archaeon]
MKKKVIQSLSRGELVRLRSQIQNQRDKIILQILYETGCTVNELVNIKYNNINVKSKTIKYPSDITKTKKSRICFISSKLVNELKKYTRGENFVYLFVTRQSYNITTKRVRQLLQSYGLKARLGKINPQVIRYTHIAHALERGITLTTIQKQVGIERLRMVQIYESLVPEEKEGEYGKFWKQ